MHLVTYYIINTLFFYKVSDRITEVFLPCHIFIILQVIKYIIPQNEGGLTQNNVTKAFLS